MPAFPDLRARYDVVVIGGGVHGAALALEAAQRGRSVLLAEKDDFCSGTSANSLKILHGGLRYLQSASLPRSRDSAREQSCLMALAPHLVEDLPCLMGTGRSLARSRLAMGLGMWFYDRVVRFGLPRRPPGRLVTVSEASRIAGADLFEGCTGAALWHDARVRDSERMVMTYLKTAEGAGARILNYTSVTDVKPGPVASVALRDEPGGDTAEVTADQVMDTASFLSPHPHWARGVNLVLDRRPPDCAVGLPLSDGRLLFVTPHDDATLVGTWYFPDRAAPGGLAGDELARCVSDVRSMLPHLDINDKDVRLVHVGRLPVANPSDPLSLLEAPRIQPVAGDHRLLSITGVKYTTARATARRALRLAGIAGRESARGPGHWYGAGGCADAAGRLGAQLTARLGTDAGERILRRLCRQYGSVAADILETALQKDDGFEPIPSCDAVTAEIDYCIEQEHCRTVSDFLLRRSGLGSVRAVPQIAAAHCADVMARRLGWSTARRDLELERLSGHYHRVDAAL